MRKLVGKKLLSITLAAGMFMGIVSFPGYTEAFTSNKTITFSQLKNFLASRNQDTAPTPTPVKEVEPAPAPAPAPIVVTPTPEAPTTPVTDAKEDKVYPLLPGEEAVELWFLSMINKERTSRGIKPLTLDPDLQRLARFKSHDMKDNKFFAHLSPTHGRFSDMLKKEGMIYFAAGENLGRGSRAVTIHYMFMESDGHRRNLLKSNYTHVGIGVVKTSGGYLVTQHYIAK